MKTKTSATEARKVRLSVSVRAVNYVGVSKSVIKKFNDTAQIQPGNHITFHVHNIHVHCTCTCIVLFSWEHCVHTMSCIHVNMFLTLTYVG